MLYRREDKKAESEREGHCNEAVWAAMVIDADARYGHWSACYRLWEGWLTNSHATFQQYAIIKSDALKDLRIVENKENIPWSAYVGICGMPGAILTARPQFIRRLTCTHSQDKPPTTDGRNSRSRT